MEKQRLQDECQEQSRANRTFPPHTHKFRSITILAVSTSQLSREERGEELAFLEKVENRDVSRGKSRENRGLWGQTEKAESMFEGSS